MYLAVIAVGLVSLYLIRLLHRPAAPLPPGPKGLPLLGNIRDLPDTNSPDWLHWLKHKDLYGPISTLTVLGQRLIILNDAQAAFEILEKKSIVSSNRPSLPFARLCGIEDTILMQPYGKQLKSYRTYVHHEIGSSSSAARFNRAQSIEVRRFLLRLLDAPQHLRRHAHGLAGAFILRVLYGYQIDYTREDPLLCYIEETLEVLTAAVVPGTWLVDSIPALKHVPAWFPGAGFQRTAQHLRAKLQFLLDLPFAFVKDQVHLGNNEPSYVSNLLRDKGISPGSNEESEVKWTAVSLYFGGADTTVSTISSFFLAMVLYPDVQRQAQEEIDRVIGRGRLPDHADRVHLPYINAVVKEALRWHPVVPMGVAHSMMEDDIYDGYLIPKGSIIMPNIWGFCHDPKDYRDPMDFQPERFLGDSPERDPSFVFGYGRRICPGRVVADSSVYLAVVTSLAAFNIGKKIRDGEELKVETHFLPGMVSHPAPFEMDIALRDPKYGDLVQSVESEHPWEENDAKIVHEMLGSQR
ncbi:cytochrome P450 [Aspergillus unguis]